MKDYSRLPNVVWTHASEIGPSGITMFAALNKFARNGTGRCFPSISLLENFTGLSRNTVITALENLRKCKLITSTRNSGRHNVYELDGYQDDKPEQPTSANSELVSSANSELVSSANSDTTSANSGSEPVQNLHPNLDLGTKTQELISSSKGAKPPRAGGAADGPLSSIEESQSQTPAPITATGTMLPSEDTAQVLTAMRRFFRPSQAVVEKLIAECRERNPAATMEEISRAIVDAGSSCSRNVRSIAGVIIKQAPLLLEGDAYRLEKQKHEEARRHNEEADEEAARQEEKSEQSAAQHEQELLEAKDRLRERERAKHRRETQDPTKTPWWKAREWSSKEYRGSRFDRAIAPLIFDRWERGTMFLWAPSLEVLGAAARLHQEIEDATRVVKGHHVEVKIFCDEASR